MTREEAQNHAQALYGPGAGAAEHRRAGKPNTYSVGLVALDGTGVMLGIGRTYEDAFRNAADRGANSKAVAKAIRAANRRLKWQRLWVAVRGLFR